MLAGGKLLSIAEKEVAFFATFSSHLLKMGVVAVVVIVAFYYDCYYYGLTC